MRRTPLIQWLLSLVAFLVLLVLGSFLFWLWQYPETISTRLMLPQGRRAFVAGHDVQVTLRSNGGYIAEPELVIESGDAQNVTAFTSRSRPWQVSTVWRTPSRPQTLTLQARFETIVGTTVETDPLPVDVVPAGAIAYVREDAGKPPSIYVMQTDGSNRARWAERADAPAWGPDGALYFLRESVVWRQENVATPPQQLTDARIDVVAFSLGPQLALVDAQGRLYLYDDTGALTPISLGVDAALGVAWRPDGQALAVSARNDGNVDLYQYSLSDRTVAPLTNDPAVDSQPAWHPAGDRILFTSDRSGGRQIYWMAPYSKMPAPIPVTDAPHGAHHADWNPTGKWLVYSQQRTRAPESSDIVLRPIEQEYAVQVTRTDAVVRSPVWR